MNVRVAAERGGAEGDRGPRPQVETAGIADHDAPVQESVPLERLALLAPDAGVPFAPLAGGRGRPDVVAQLLGPAMSVALDLGALVEDVPAGLFLPPRLREPLQEVLDGLLDRDLPAALLRQEVLVVLDRVQFGGRQIDGTDEHLDTPIGDGADRHLMIALRPALHAGLSVVIALRARRREPRILFRCNGLLISTAHGQIFASRSRREA